MVWLNLWEAGWGWDWGWRRRRWWWEDEWGFVVCWFVTCLVNFCEGKFEIFWIEKGDHHPAPTTTKHPFSKRPFSSPPISLHPPTPLYFYSIVLSNIQTFSIGTRIATTTFNIIIIVNLSLLKIIRFRASRSHTFFPPIPHIVQSGIHILFWCTLSFPFTPCHNTSNTSLYINLPQY